jgi:nitric oxide reductase large subunit
MKSFALAIIALAIFSSCSRSKTAPFIGSLAGATGGAALGGIPGAAIGSTMGYGGGIAYDWAADPDKKEIVDQISQGQIAEVIAAQVAKQNTGLTSFLKDLQKMLIFAAIGLGIYLSIPLFYSKHCQKQAEQNMTRPPFPKK